MFRKTNWFLALLIAAFFTIHVYSLDPQKKPEENLQTVWTSENGLPSDNITDIIQDKKGYIWIATYNGLVRFDGIDFEVFSRRNTSGFQSNSIYSLCLAEDGTVWIGTNGDGVIKFINNRFIQYTFMQGIKGEIVRSLCELSDGRMVAGTNNGISIIHRDGSVVSPVHPLLENKNIVMLFHDRSDNVWIADSEGHLLESDIHFKNIRHSEIGKKINYVTCMSEGPGGILWFGTLNSGMYFKKDSLVNVFKESGYFELETINHIMFDKYNVMWISTDSGIFKIFNNDVFPFNTSNGFSDNQGSRMLEDNEGNIWITTSRSGVTKLSNGKFFILSAVHGLSHNIVNSIIHHSSGSYYIGTDSGLNIFNNGLLIQNKLTHALSHIRIRHIMEDSNGKVFISTYSDSGVVKWDGRNIEYLNKNTGLTGNRTRMSFEDSDGCTWIGTTNGLNVVKNGVVQTYTKSNGLENNYILCIYEDKDKRIWVGTNGGGIAVFEKGSIEIINKADGLPSNFIFRFLQDSRDNMWICTNEGVSLFMDGHFYTFTADNGLFGNAIFQILEDSNATMWMTAEAGVFSAPLNEMMGQYDKVKKFVKMELYNSIDGLPGASTPVSWAIQSDDGKLWFPTLKGVAVLDPHGIQKNDLPPPIFIKSIEIDNTIVYPEDFRAVKRGFKRMTFNFNGLSYMMPQEVKFKHRLLGFDDNWEISKNRSASYTSLPAGEYTFQVLAMNNDGVWSSNPASVTFVKKPEFRETWGFYLLVVSSGLLIAGLYFRIRSRNLRRRKRELEQIVRERTKEIEEKNMILEQQKNDLEKSQKEITLINKKLEKLSTTDPLTGLANRRHFQTYLEHEWKRAMRSKNPVSLIMLDVDYFKDFNDNYGHQEGDSVLQNIAESIRKSLYRHTDMAARYGGEEFIIILPKTDEKNALMIAERIRETTKNDKALSKKTRNADRVTVSMGLFTAVPLPDRTYEYLIRNADDALYQAKHEGRDKVVVFKKEGKV